MLMPDTGALAVGEGLGRAACLGAVLLGASVKGTLGIGMPLVAVPLLSLFIPATQAIALRVLLGFLGAVALLLAVR